MHKFRNLSYLTGMALSSSFLFFRKAPFILMQKQETRLQLSDQSSVSFQSKNVANFLGVEEKFINSIKLEPVGNNKVQMAVRLAPCFKVQEKKWRVKLNSMHEKLIEHNIVMIVVFVMLL